MRYALLLLGLGAWCCLPAAGYDYWFAWEGNDFPEYHRYPVSYQWRRIWGDWQPPSYNRGGARRTLYDGILTYDSLSDPSIFDGSEMDRQGDPDLGSMFVAEWRLRVDQVIGRADPTVAICSNQAWCLAFEFATDRIYSVFESYLQIPFAPGVFHDYRVVSPDMHTYDLFIDGQLARHGAFLHLLGAPYIAWGDGIQGAASVHEWDYFRFGVTSVVPEPAGLWQLLMPSIWVLGRRGS